MDRRPYDIRSSIGVRRMVLLSKHDGQLQQLRKQYEQFRWGNKKPVPGQKRTRDHLEDAEEICPLAKRRRMQNVKIRLREALRIQLSPIEEL